MRKMVFNQPRGIGDILFLMPVAKMYYNAGYEVVWPVIAEFLSLQKHFPYVKFVRKDVFPIDYETQKVVIDDEKIVLPIMWTDHLMKIPYDGSHPDNLKDCMKSKYEWLRLDIDMWRNLEWVHDSASERKLYHDVVFLHPYCLVNRNMRMESTLQLHHPQLPQLPVVEMRFIEGFTMLDWYEVIINAEEIHTVATGLMYLIESSPIKAKVHIYKRPPWEDNHDYYRYLFKKHNLIYHE